jgi:hypothetical protein
MSEQLTTVDLLRFMSKKQLLPLLTTFNRLEGRPRAKNFDQALRVEVRDPLWMLTKQWQMGEFKGDDAGSPVTSKVCMERTQLTKYQAATHDAEAFDDSMPLETKVEQRRIPFTAGELQLSLDLRIIMGRYWAKLLHKQGFDASLKNKYIAAFLTYDPDPLNRDDVYYAANQQSWRKHKAIAGRHIDGKKLYDSIKFDPSQHPNLAGVDVGLHPDLIDLGMRFAAWFDKLYVQPDADHHDAWLPRNLEYQFACSAPKGDSEQMFSAKEYYHGHLDWYNFSIDESQDSLGEVTEEVIPEDINKPIVRSFIPTPVQFDGMPNTRWWSFEEGKTNFGDIRPDTTDINKLLLMEFGLVYANDWYLLPVTIPAGSILNVKGMSVKNVFGEHLWVTASGRGLDDSPDRWTMYSMDIAGDERRRADLSLMIVPSVPKIQEGQAIEEVQLTRDEMANMVWGIETRIPLASGESTPGREAARDTVNYIKRIIGDAAILAEETVEPAASLRYKVMSSVPENWIPFISTHVEGSNRTIQLQRSSMPRIIEGDTESIQKVKPRTNLLREGLDQTVKQGYFLHEHEVPRAGIQVRQSFQRARWYNGAVFTWLGARKRTGRGEASSQLSFDYLVATKKVST